MKRTLSRLGLLPAVWSMVVVFTLFSGWALAQQSRPGSPPGGGSGTMQMMPGMMRMMPKMMQMMPGMMRGMGPRMEGPSMMHAMGGMKGMMTGFHEWIGRFMAHKDALGLSRDQVIQVEKGIFQHLKDVVLNRAQAQALRLDIQMALRNPPVELQAIEEILGKIADLDVQLQLGWIRLYTEILGLLTDEQKARVLKLIGRPLPPPWKAMAMQPPMEPSVQAQKEGQGPAASQSTGGMAGSGGHHPGKK